MKPGSRRSHLPARGPARVPWVILSVDDEPSILFTRHKLLQAAGYDVLSAADGEQALHFFAMHAVDLVLLDYAMPGIDGGIVAREMKAQHQKRAGDHGFGKPHSRRNSPVCRFLPNQRAVPGAVVRQDQRAALEWTSGVRQLVQGSRQARSRCADCSLEARWTACAGPAAIARARLLNCVIGIHKRAQVNKSRRRYC